MGYCDWAQGGASGFGPSSTTDALPFANYKSVATWIEEFVDAIGIQLDIRNRRFIGSAKNGDTPSRANALDPTYTSTLVPSDYHATYISPANLAPIKDTILDVLLYISGIPWPVDSNLTVAQKQQLVINGWQSLVFKGGKRQLLSLIATIVDGIVDGWNTPTSNATIICPDGSPNPGFGPWVQNQKSVALAGTITVTHNSATVTGASTTFLSNFIPGSRISIDGFTWYVVTSVGGNTSLTLNQNYAGSNASGQTYYTLAQGLSRPWLFKAIQNTTARIVPAWESLGIGYSQFRAGYSAAGEPTLPSGATLNLLANDSLSSWSSGTPSSWTAATSGNGSLVQSNNDGFIDTELSPSCAVYSWAGTANSTVSLSQTCGHINNQKTHRFNVQYSYANPANVSTLFAQITDTSVSTSYYYNPTTQVWTSTAYNIPIPPSGAATLVGTVTLSSSSPSVTGSGTSFTTQLVIGQNISVDLINWYQVQSIASDTALTLTANPIANSSNVTGYGQTRGQFGFDILPQRRDTGYALTGTISLTAGSTALTGTGTLFTAQLAIGTLISVDQHRWYTVASIASDTSATLTMNALATASNVPGFYSYYAATSSLAVLIKATSDGTSNYKQPISIYQVGVHEKYNLALEQQAFGERTLWLPLVDSPGWTAATKASTHTLVEPANFDRSAFRVYTTNIVDFPYTPSISKRGFRATSTWTNLVTSPVSFVTGWTATDCTVTQNNAISPAVGETSATASTVLASVADANVAQLYSSITPTSKVYVGGVWAKKLTADPVQAGTATFTLGSATVTGSGTSFVTTGTWNGALIKTAGGNVYQISSVSSATSLTLISPVGVTESAVTFSISDINISFASVNTYYAPYFLSQAQGWQLLPFKFTMGAGDSSHPTLTIAIGNASSTSNFALSSAYLYDVTSNPGVLYPPVVQAADGATSSVGATTCQVGTQITGTNVLSPLLQRTLVSVIRGSCTLTLVPTFDGTSQPNSVIFDVSKDSTHDRVYLSVSSGTLLLKRYDDSSNTTSCSLTLSLSPSPASGSMTWLRDQPITVHCIWDENGTFLSAGNGNTFTAIPNTWAPSDALVANINIGNDNSSANQFDGVITGFEVDQLGAPVS